MKILPIFFYGVVTVYVVAFRCACAGRQEVKIICIVLAWKPRRDLIKMINMLCLLPELILWL